MRALVIVHPEPQDPEDIEIVFKTSIFPTRLEPLYTLIGNYLGGYRDLYDYIAYLASDSEDWDSPLVYPGIGRYADKMEHISHLMLESQLLDLKYGLMQRGVQQVDIAGLSRYECVKETDVFLRGDMEPNVRMEDSAIGDFDMDTDLYDEIVAHKIKTRVLERLTDEPVEPAADPSTYFRRRRNPWYRIKSKGLDKERSGRKELWYTIMGIVPRVSEVFEEVEATYCEYAGCEQKTSGKKPFCIEHLEEQLLPTHKRIKKYMEELEQITEAGGWGSTAQRVRERGERIRSLVEQHLKGQPSLVIDEILRILKESPSLPLPTLANKLLSGLEPRRMIDLLDELHKHGLVSVIKEGGGEFPDTRWAAGRGGNTKLRNLDMMEL